MNYWAIAERDIEIQNPITDRKLRLLDDYCDIRDGLSVLDIGCGKAWVMRQWAEKFAIEGVGIDINRALPRGGAAQVAGSADGSTFIEGPAKGFKVEPASFDVVLCLGATCVAGRRVGGARMDGGRRQAGRHDGAGRRPCCKHPPAVPKGEILPPDTARA